MTAPLATSRPNDTELDDAAVATLRAVLLEALDDDRAQLVELRRVVDELAGQHDAESLQEREMAERGISRGTEAVADIEHALGRIDDGTYGTCEVCAGAISVARLEAIPQARVCVTCTPGRLRLFG